MAMEKSDMGLNLFWPVYIGAGGGDTCIACLKLYISSVRAKTCPYRCVYKIVLVWLN